MLSRSAARLLAQHSPCLVRGFASVGDKLPSVEIHQGFPPKKYDLAEYTKDKDVVIVGLPGAFTPT